MQLAERLGYDSFWTAEAYGSDALTPLAWWGSKTETIKLGTGIIQISARTPAATAMAAITMDHLCGGRFILGLGVSGPQVVEGWYGAPYNKPLARTREYIQIIRDIIDREKPVSFVGDQYQMPFPGGMELGKPLKSTVHPFRNHIPIYLGAEGPKNVALAAEICDGWLPLFFAPKDNQFYVDALNKGFAAAGKPLIGETGNDFEVVCPVSIIPNDDIEAAADRIRPMLALYMGGMGAKGANFHHEVFCRMGYEDVADRVQELYLEGKKQEAAAAIPVKLVEEIALIGPIDKIKEDLAQWDDSVVTTLQISGPDQLLELMATVVLA
jgi:F420-dependent oxidoreductase-like protein